MNRKERNYIFFAVVVTILIIIVILLNALVLIGVAILYKDYDIGNIKSKTTEKKVESDYHGKIDEEVTISIDEWIGWKPLLDANGGLNTAPDSINARNGIKVKYVISNDAVLSSKGLIVGELQGAGYTVNLYALEQTKFEEAGVEVVMPFICSGSNGADGIIAKSDIKTISDLVGRTLAVTRFSDHHAMIEWMISHSNLTVEEQKKIRDNMVFFQNADVTARAFFSGEVDAATTWEPFLTIANDPVDCKFLNHSTESRVLFDTSMSNNLILNGIVFRKDFTERNEEFMVRWIDGALEATSMYRKEFKNIRQMPIFELMSDEEIINMSKKTNLFSCYENERLLTGNAVQMYRDMAEVWMTVGARAYPERAETAFSDRYIKILLAKYHSSEE